MLLAHIKCRRFDTLTHTLCDQDILQLTKLHVAFNLKLYNEIFLVELNLHVASLEVITVIHFLADDVHGVIESLKIYLGRDVKRRHELLFCALEK